MSYSKVNLLGFIGKDPQFITFPNGGSVCNISLATTEKWTDKTTREKNETTSWHSLVFKNKKAEIAQEYLKKGAKLFIEGRLNYRKWTDSNGNNRMSTEIIVLEFEMLSSNNQANQNQGQSQTNNQYQPQASQRQAQANAPQQAQTNHQSQSAHMQAQPNYVDEFDDVPF